ncbi:DsbA family protein [Novosphingobium sp.]|uniref:DsbA family protein n=1 Tax=Novosphingobium sp. TaxID=1874826 RepID=UPI003B51AF26
MQINPGKNPSRLRLVLLAIVLFALGAGSVGLIGRLRPHGDDTVSADLARAGIDPARRVAFEELVHAYILDHPEILPEAMDKLQAREAAARLKPVRAAVESPFPGAILGNPAGTVTMVEFSDYSCTYCRGSVADINALVAANPDLKVVLRELPIIAPASEPAAKMALAAAAQGKFGAYHAAMFAGERPDDASIAAAATTAGLDLTSARAYAARAEVQQEIEHNLAFARQLGVSGTPAFTIGGQIISGAVGKDKLQAAVDAARKGVTPA